MTRWTALGLACCGALALRASAQDQWWSNGDGWQRTGLACERNTLIADARTYDDFDVTTRAAVRGAWGNFLIRDFTPLKAYYEIRSNISPGNGGTLHAAGEMPVVVSKTGRMTMDYTEYLVRGHFPEEVVLEPGRYWVTVAPIGQGTGRCFVSDTNAKNELPDFDETSPPMGTPHLNHNSFFDSETFGSKFRDTRDELGGASWDFAFGVGPNTGPPVRVLPDAFQVPYGELLQGQLSDLFDYDGRRVVIQQRLNARISAPNAQLVIDGRLPFETPGYLTFEFVSCATAAPRDAVIQRLEFFDFRSATWTTIDEGGAGKYDCKRVGPTVTVDADRFVEPGTGNVRAALSWFDRGSATLNWSATIDQTRWIAEPK